MSPLVWLWLFFSLFPGSPHAPQECGIFEVRHVPPGVWQMRVGCDAYSEWMLPESITFTPDAYYPNGLIADDGSFIQHHLTGCFAEWGCPLTPGLPVYDAAGHKLQINGYYAVYLPTVFRP